MAPQPDTPGDDNFPLRGLRVVVTRARAQADELSARLRALGAEPVEIPAIRVAPPEDDFAALDRALRGLGEYDWLLFTSANAVEAFWERLGSGGKGSGALSALRVGAVGRATAGALEARGRAADLIPEESRGAGLLEALLDGEGVRGARFLLPRADIAREELREGLVAAGALVDAPVAYRTLPGEPDDEALAVLEAGVDVLTFTSGSTARNFATMLGEARLQALGERATVAAIGPVTARAIEGLGLRADVVAAEQSVAGLVEAIVAHVRQLPFRFSPITAEEANEVLAWAYEGRYAMYNADPENREAEIAYFTDPANQLFAIRRAGGELVGFCSFGRDARVPGFDYDEAALDVGAGMRPGLTGQGHGAAFMAAILGFGRRRFAPAAFRATIASWNERALRMAERAGFERGPTFVNSSGPAGKEFTVLLRRERGPE